MHLTYGCSEISHTAWWHACCELRYNLFPNAINYAHKMFIKLATGANSINFFWSLTLWTNKQEHLSHASFLSLNLQVLEWTTMVDNSLTENIRLYVGLLAVPTHTRVGCIGFKRLNTLAYLCRASVTKQEVFDTLNRRQSGLNKNV